MTVPLPQGEGYILLEYGDTAPRKAGRIFSFTALILLGALIVVAFVRQRR